MAKSTKKKAAKRKPAKKKAAKKKATKKKATKKSSPRKPKAPVQQTLVSPPSTLPPKGQRQWSAVYSNAKLRFMQSGVAEKEAKNAAARQAWCVVKRYYQQRAGAWVPRARPIAMDKYPPGCGPALAANPTALVGDRIRFLEGPVGQTGRVEDTIRNTYWVRMDQDKSLVATHANNVEIVERGRAHRAIRGTRNNPSEEVVNAAYRYVAALDNLQGAMQIGKRADVRQAKELVDLAEANLIDATGAPSPIAAALAAAVGGGLGALAGPGWAALASGVGAFAGSTLGGISEAEEQKLPAAPRQAVQAMRPESAVEGRILGGEASASAPARAAAGIARPPRPAPQPGRPAGRRAPPAPPKKRSPESEQTARLVAVPTPEPSPPGGLIVDDDTGDFMDLDDMAVGNPRTRIKRLKNSLLK